MHRWKTIELEWLVASAQAMQRRQQGVMKEERLWQVGTWLCSRAEEVRSSYGGRRRGKLAAVQRGRGRAGAAGTRRTLQIVRHRAYAQHAHSPPAAESPSALRVLHGASHCRCSQFLFRASLIHSPSALRCHGHF